MKRSILLLLVVAFGIQLGAMPAVAAIPANLSYQGMLTEQDGSTVADGDPSRPLNTRLWWPERGTTPVPCHPNCQ